MDQWALEAGESPVESWNGRCRQGGTDQPSRGQSSSRCVVTMRCAAQRQHGLHAQAVAGRIGLAVDKATPRLVALVHDLSRVLLVLGLTAEGERILGLAIG